MQTKSKQDEEYAEDEKKGMKKGYKMAKISRTQRVE
jgi:hypothetical protein